MRHSSKVRPRRLPRSSTRDQSCEFAPEFARTPKVGRRLRPIAVGARRSASHLRQAMACCTRDRTPFMSVAARCIAGRTRRQARRSTELNSYVGQRFPSDSGEILEQVRIAVAEAIRENQPLKLPDLATELNVHVRTLQAAARSGRLEVEYSTRSVFGRPLRLSTRAAGTRFLQTYYKRYGGQPVGRFELPRPVPADCQRRLRELRLRLDISLRDMAELVGAANRAVVYQWESGKRVPSPIFWDRISTLSRWANKPSANINPRARSSVG